MFDSPKKFILKTIYFAWVNKTRIIAEHYDLLE